MDSDKWREIEKAFRAGTALRVICERFGINLGDLCRRIRAEGWKRGEPGVANDRSEDGDSSGPTDAERLPTVLTPEVERLIGQVVLETATEIADAHKGIARKLRARLSIELDEFDESAKYFGQFRDVDHIARLAAKDDGGEELRAYLTQCLQHQAKRTEMLDRLSRISEQVVDLERSVWSLDENTEPQSVDELWEKANRPLAPRHLPKNFRDFERKALTLVPRRGPGHG